MTDDQFIWKIPGTLMRPPMRMNIPVIDRNPNGIFEGISGDLIAIRDGMGGITFYANTDGAKKWMVWWVGNEKDANFALGLGY